MSEHLPGDNTTGLLALTTGGALAALVYGARSMWGWLTGGRRRAAREEARQVGVDQARALTDQARAMTDRETEATFARNSRDLSRYVAELVTERARADLWEIRARRADWWAHAWRHIICDLYPRHGYTDPIARIPLLEDAFREDRSLDFPEIMTPQPNQPKQETRQ